MNRITFYGADWCPDCQRAKKFLAENDITYTMVDVDINKEATELVETINNGKRIIPTILINGVSFTNPSNHQLAVALGINDTGRVILYGADWCPDCRRAKNYLQKNNINYLFIDVDEHDWATAKVEEINRGKRIIPTILIDGTPYTNPDNGILKKVLEIGAEATAELYDAVIVGGGAAGLTTAIYAQRDKFNTIILEKKNVGGNASLTKTIENYPGFTNISGPDLMEKMADQAKTYGAKIEIGIDVKNIIKNKDHFILDTNMGRYQGRSVVLAVGSTYKKLNIPNEDDLIGSGVHFCATCDGAFYRDKEILVIGGGNSALEEGIFLSGFCKKVIIVSQGEEFTASETYIDKLPSIDNIVTYKNKESLSFTKTDDDLFKGLIVEDRKTGETKELIADGAFVFIGSIPNTHNFTGIIDLDDNGFIKTTGMGQTSLTGIFAAGDCREGAIAQVAAATGEGVLASYGVRTFLKY